MALAHPELKFTGTAHSHSDKFRVRIDPKLIATGLGKHELPIADAVPAKAKGVPLVVIWPLDRPGVAHITLREESAVLEYRLARPDQLGGVWEPKSTEGLDEDDWLASFDLAREPGSPAKVLHRPKAEATFRSPGNAAARFEGVLFDLEVLIFESPDTRGEPAQRLWIEGIPIIEQGALADDAELDEKEGWSWELLATCEFEPDAVRGGTPQLEKKIDWANGRDIDSYSFCTLPRAAAVDFKVKLGRDAHPQDLADRYVLGLHLVEAVVGTHRTSPMPLVEVVLDGVGVAPRYVPARVELELTAKEKEALPALKDVPIRDGKQKGWIKDAKIVANPDKLLKRELDTKKNVVLRHLHKVSQYWVLPTDFYRRTEALQLSKEPELTTARAPRIAAANGASQDIVFTMASEWDRYAEELGRVERHLELMKAWQELYARAYEKDREELEAFTRIVQPICGDAAFGGVEFPTKGSTVGGMHTVRLRTLRHDGNTSSTEGKLHTLRLMTDRVAHHARKAIAAFASLDLLPTFLGKKFLDEKKVFRRSKYTDRFEHMRVTVKERELAYDDALKLQLLGAVAGAFPLAMDEAAGGAADAERKERQAQFRRLVSGPLQELIKSNLEDAKKEAPVSFLTGKLSSAKLWSTLGGGGFAIFWYGDDAARDLLAQRFTGRSFASRRDLLALSDEQWDHLAGEIAAREGLPRGMWDNVELAVGFIKVATDVLKLLDGNDDKVQLALDAADALLAASEVMLKTVKLVRPLWFEVDGVAKAGGQALKVVGHIAKVLSLLKDLYTIFKTFWKLRRGRLVKASDVYFALANIALMVVALFVPVVGAIIGFVFMFVQQVFAYYSVSGMEAIPAWYCRTPWGENIYFSYAKHNGGELHWTDRRTMFIEGCNALNKLLDEIYGKLKQEQRDAFRQFYQSWAESNAAGLKLRASRFEDGKDYFLIKLYDGQREVTSQSAE